MRLNASEIKEVAEGHKVNGRVGLGRPGVKSTCIADLMNGTIRARRVACERVGINGELGASRRRPSLNGHDARNTWGKESLRGRDERTRETVGEVIG